jgi:uncharacterized membrane protein (UPF0127 family)
MGGNERAGDGAFLYGCAMNEKEPLFSKSFRGKVGVRLAPQGEPLAKRVKICRSFGSRLLGLMFRRRLATDAGALLIFARASRLDTSIHMFFVPFALGVFWLDDEGQVVDAVHARPWRPFYAAQKPARYVLELPEAALRTLRIGDTVALYETNPSL